jgi:hypothetical protein
MNARSVILLFPLWYSPLVYILAPFPLLYITRPPVRPGIFKTSCYLMPCPPHKVSDMDQAFRLFAGLISPALEVGSHLVGFRRERKRLNAELQGEYRLRLQRIQNITSLVGPEEMVDVGGIERTNTTGVVSGKSAQTSVVKRTNTASAIV